MVEPKLWPGSEYVFGVEGDESTTFLPLAVREWAGGFVEISGNIVKS